MAFGGIPKASGREHVKAFRALGWTERKSKNGHIILTKAGVSMIVSIPDHREVRCGLISNQLRKAGIPEAVYLAAFMAAS
jgi:predicted RNA binding protein YcfA (HicA-like mRNA interferase family)